MNGRAELIEALCDELEYLWGDLESAVYPALNGRWSVQCDGLESRIKTLTQLVGPTPWERVGMRLLENGTYQRIHAELGMPAVPDMQRVAEIRDRMGR